MSDAVTITLIIAVVVVILLYLFRSSLSSFFFRASKDGVEGKLETRSPASPGDTAQARSPRLEVSGNRQMGKNNRIAVDADDAAVRDNTQTGSGQKLDVKQPKPPIQP